MIISILICVILAFSVYGCIKCCCTSKTQGAVISTSPIIVTSEVHRVAPGATQVMPPPPPGTIIQNHSISTTTYPVMTAPYPGQHPAPYPSQPYVQHYSLQTSAASPSMPPQQHANAAPVQFPALPTHLHAAGAPPMEGAAFMNPPSYDQVVTGGVYPVKAP